MSTPTAERIHRKKLKRLRKRRTLAAYHRVGISRADGRRTEDAYFGPQAYGFTTRPRK